LSSPGKVFFSCGCVLQKLAKSAVHLTSVTKRHPTSSTNTPIPPKRTIEELEKAAKDCKACDLWKRATQTVFGEGEADARILFVGEQPGNQEDLEGKPFVGPAGKLLDTALLEAGIDRRKAYVTNAVKHFKWEPRGKRRIHKKPNAAEIAACRPWLEAEIGALRPKVIVCLGATAAQALLGRDFRVTQHRGEFLKSPLASFVMATVHPSSILRAPDDETRDDEMKRFISDLKKISRVV
jgi:uracil-DNA glycosylase